MKILVKNVAETQKIAAELAAKVLALPKSKNAKVVALVGDLGAGKTTFVQSFLKELGVKGRIVSPTFLIFKPYTLNAVPYTLAYHVDVYRLKNSEELKVLKFQEILDNPQNIVLVEWADKIKEILPADALWINFEHGSKESERFIDVRDLDRKV